LFSRPMIRTTRRDLLRIGLLGSLSPLMGRAGSAEAAARELIVRSTRPQDLETPVTALVDEYTPNDIFFVRSHFGPPAMDISSWKLHVEGMVERPADLSMSQIRKLGAAKAPAFLQCAGNGRALFRPKVAGAQWERGAVGQAMWRGVPLSDVLKHAGVKPGAKFVTFLPGDHPMAPTVPKFLRSIPLDKAMDDVLLAWEMNGTALPLLHGAPLRAVVPGWAGDHWIKWLRGLRVSDAEDPGFYMQTGYKVPTEPIPPGGKPAKVKTLTTIPVKSLIARPAEGSALTAGKQTIQGVAFGGKGPITQVEVSVDDGQSWEPARVDRMPAPGAWQRWKLEWRAQPGQHVLLARATDSAGEIQPRDPQWNPGGYLYNAWDSVRCEVRS
jgi:DMSO/TMAO reductase YedYZ molybdopterin-dependent catalytic subunit